MNWQAKIGLTLRSGYKRSKFGVDLLQVHQGFGIGLASLDLFANAAGWEENWLKGTVPLVSLAQLAKGKKSRP